jgi:hypothetical protein
MTPKRTIGITMLLAFSLTMANCSTTVHTNSTATKSKKVPPGQAKKAAGAKSAKAYAPGHN